MKTIDVLLAAFLASLLVLINVIISYQMGGWAASYASFYSFKKDPGHDWKECVRHRD